jgi:hypothetical protein
MNRIVTTAVSMLASLVMVNGATAQKRAVRVVIPFAFSASGAELSAGAYTIASEDGFTSIIEDSTGKSMFVSTIPAIDNLQDDSKLVFSTDGGQHFLRKILCPSLNMSLELLPSKPKIKARLERENSSGN